MTKTERVRRDAWADQTLGSLNLAQKVGQMLVFGMGSSVITPDVVDLIQNHHLGGLRISQSFRCVVLTHDVKPGEAPDPVTLKSLVRPRGFNRDYAPGYPPTSATAYEFAQVLDTLRRYSLDRPGGIPIHFTIDQEGGGTSDLLGGHRLFPHPMGMTASGDPALAYRIGLALARQAKATGADMIHSPVLDVNTNPLNPEVYSRSYGDNADDVIRFARQSLRGLLEGGLIATGKHFPGRGESADDAHWGLPTVPLSLEELTRVHIAPYQALIAEGLPAIMSAHCCYPALDDSGRPASLSRAILTDYLRKELGFQGVVTTDNMMMGGILKQQEMSQAIVEALIAGNDLILCRDESPIRYRIIEQVTDAIKSGRLKEAEVDQKVLRILKMRWDMGLLENEGRIDPLNAQALTQDPAVGEAAREGAEKTLLVMRNREKVLPLSTQTRVLLVEQVCLSHEAANTMDLHPGMLWEEMLKLSPQVMSVEIPIQPTEQDKARVRRRLDLREHEVVVITNYYHNKTASDIRDLIAEIQRRGKPVVVLTNCPYVFGAGDFPTVVVCFEPAAQEHLQVMAQTLYGAFTPTARLPVKL